MSQERPMIAEKRKACHPRSESRQCGREIRIPHGRTPGRDASEIHSPADQSVQCVAQPVAALVLRHQVDARCKSDGVELLGRGEPPQPFPAFGLAPRVGKVPCQEGRAAGLRQHAFRIGNPVFRQPGPGEVGRRQRHDLPQATAANRRRQATGLVRDQQQGGSGRGFLQGLEERVRGGIVHRLGGSDHRDLRAPAMAGHLRPLGQIADRVDPDHVLRRRVALLVVNHGLDDAQVGMLPGGDVIAARACTACRAVGARRLAQARTCDAHRQHALADALGPLDQQRLREAHTCAEELALGRGLPRQARRKRQPHGRRWRQLVAHASASTMRPRSARTASRGRSAAITRNRDGSAAARAR